MRWRLVLSLRLAQLRSSSAGLGLTLVPVFGLVGASLWLGEVPTTTMLFGALLILAAVVVGSGRNDPAVCKKHVDDIRGVVNDVA